MNRRVAITGLGAVTALGADVAAFADGLRAGRSGVRQPLTLFDVSGFRSSWAAQVDGALGVPIDFAHIDDADPLPSSRPDRFALAAVAEALRQAGLTTPDIARAAVLFGTGTGGAEITEHYFRRWHAGETPPPKLLVPH